MISVILFAIGLVVFFHPNGDQSLGFVIVFFSIIPSLIFILNEIVESDIAELMWIKRHKKIQEKRKEPR